MVVDPRHSETAILADEWLPIKPGTDLAFLLAMINVMVKEELYDRKFVGKRPSASNNWRMRSSTILRNGRKRSAKYRRRRSSGSPGRWPRRNPEPSFTVDITRAFGSQYLNSFQTVRALAIANSLLGNINREGGIYFPKTAQLGELQPKHPAPDLPKMAKADGTGVPGRYPLGSYGDGIAHAIPELALRGELKAGFVYHNNPLRTNPNPKRVIAGYKKLDLLVVIDTVLSETASIAHYVLPESFYLERMRPLTRNIAERGPRSAFNSRWSNLCLIPGLGRRSSSNWRNIWVWEDILISISMKPIDCDCNPSV